MALCFEDVSFSYGDVAVLNDINVCADAGEITCLLGASGSGKSTLLRLAVGLERLRKGRIVIDDKVFASPDLHTPPEQRPVGLMFQESALFPNMTVAQNVAFGLTDLPKAKRADTVRQMLSLVDMDGFEGRYPHSLSGGQQQRVALARSLAPRPRVLLMDEPYANIDISLRRSVREAARTVLKQNDTATVLVTHDPQEAAEMADKIALLHAGRVVQFGTPDELYAAPNCAAVASLFGQAQIVPATACAAGFDTAWGLVRSNSAPAPGSSCTLAFRSTGLTVVPDSEGLACVADNRSVSGVPHVSLQAYEGKPLISVAVPDSALVPGERVSLIAGDTGFFVFGE